VISAFTDARKVIESVNCTFSENESHGFHDLFKYRGVYIKLINIIFDGNTTCRFIYQLRIVNKFYSDQKSNTPFILKRTKCSTYSTEKNQIFYFMLVSSSVIYTIFILFISALSSVPYYSRSLKLRN